MKRILSALLVFCCGVAATYALFLFTRQAVDTDAQLRFERQAADAKHIIERRLRSYIEVTVGVQALFAAHETPTRAQFHRYTQALKLAESYPGFEVLNYARHISAAEKPALQQVVRGDTSLSPKGYPDFDIRPTGERPQYHVLIYLEPMERNRFALGLDLAATAAQAADIARARDTGTFTASGRLRRTGKGEFAGLVMRLPIYRNGQPLDSVEQRRAAFVGTVGAGYNVREIMAGVLDETTMRAIRYRLFDVGLAGAGDNKPTLLYDSLHDAKVAPAAVATLETGNMETVLPFELAGRWWELRFSTARSAFLEPADAQLPWIVLAGGLLSSALLFAVLYAFASARERALTLAHKMTHELREAEQTQRENAAQIRDLMRRVVSVQEAERRRFAADLHDLVGQTLSVLGMRLAVARGSLPRAQLAQAEEGLDDAAKLLAETMDAVRSVIGDLRPPLLDELGLSAALRWYGRQFGERTGLRVSLQDDELRERPRTEIELALFRIAQEALTNAAKHAAATQVTLTLSGTGGAVRLAIEDDGRGVQLTENPSGTWGVAVMRERAEAVGGILRIESSGQGTCVVVSVDM